MIISLSAQIPYTLAKKWYCFNGSDLRSVTQYTKQGHLIGHWQFSNDVSASGYTPTLARRSSTLKRKWNITYPAAANRPSFKSGVSPSKNIQHNSSYFGSQNGGVVEGKGTGTDGSGNLYSFINEEGKNKSFSISVWIKFAAASIGNQAAIIAKANAGDAVCEWLLEKTTANKIEFRLYDTVNSKTAIATTPDAVTQDEWYNIVVVYESGFVAPGFGETNKYPGSRSVRIFINGADQTLDRTEVPGWISTSETATKLTVGNYSDLTAGYPAAADIAEVAIWNTNLDQFDVWALYKMTLYGGSGGCYSAYRDFREKRSYATPAGRVPMTYQGIYIDSHVSGSSESFALAVTPWIRGSDRITNLFRGDENISNRNYFDDTLRLMSPISEPRRSFGFQPSRWNSFYEAYPEDEEAAQEIIQDNAGSLAPQLDDPLWWEFMAKEGLNYNPYSLNEYWGFMNNEALNVPTPTEAWDFFVWQRGYKQTNWRYINSGSNYSDYVDNTFAASAHDPEGYQDSRYSLRFNFACDESFFGLGQSSQYDNINIYSDAVDFDPVFYLNAPDAEMWPVNIVNAGLFKERMFDGVIEPFPIRRDILLKGEKRYGFEPARGIGMALQGIYSTNRLGAEEIGFSEPITDERFPPYLDASNIFGADSATTEAGRVAGLFSDFAFYLSQSLYNEIPKPNPEFPNEPPPGGGGPGWNGISRFDAGISSLGHFNAPGIQYVNLDKTPIRPFLERNNFVQFIQPLTLGNDSRSPVMDPMIEVLERMNAPVRTAMQVQRWTPGGQGAGPAGRDLANPDIPSGIRRFSAALNVTTLSASLGSYPDYPRVYGSCGFYYFNKRDSIAFGEL